MLIPGEQLELRSLVPIKAKYNPGDTLGLYDTYYQQHNIQYLFKKNIESTHIDHKIYIRGMIYLKGTEKDNQKILKCERIIKSTIRQIISNIHQIIQHIQIFIASNNDSTGIMTLVLLDQEIELQNLLTTNINNIYFRYELISENKAPKTYHISLIEILNNLGLTEYLKDKLLLQRYYSKKSSPITIEDITQLIPTSHKIQLLLAELCKINIIIEQVLIIHHKILNNTKMPEKLKNQFIEQIMNYVKLCCLHTFFKYNQLNFNNFINKNNTEIRTLESTLPRIHQTLLNKRKSLNLYHNIYSSYYQ
jgi:hypothetical protein